MNLKLKNLIHKYDIFELKLLLIGLKSGIPFKTLAEYYDLQAEDLQNYLESKEIPAISKLNDYDQLSFVVEKSHFKESLVQTFMKQMGYPIFLFFLSFCMSFLYIKMFVPTISGLLEDLKYHESSRFLFGNFIYYLFIVFIVLCTTLIILCIFKTTRTLTYIMLHNFKLFGLYKDVLTLQFAFCFHFFLDKGLSTHDIIDALRSLDDFSDVKWVSYHVHEKLNQGMDIVTAMDMSYFNGLFLKLFKQGYLTNTLHESLVSYLEISKTSYMLKIKRYSNILKMFSYVLVMIYIGLFYSLLFKPLQILEGFM